MDNIQVYRLPTIEIIQGSTQVIGFKFVDECGRNIDTTLFTMGLNICRYGDYSTPVVSTIGGNVTEKDSTVFTVILDDKTTESLVDRKYTYQPVLTFNHKQNGVDKKIPYLKAQGDLVVVPRVAPIIKTQ